MPALSIKTLANTLSHLIFPFTSNLSLGWTVPIPTFLLSCNTIVHSFSFGKVNIPPKTLYELLRFLKYNPENSLIDSLFLYPNWAPTAFCCSSVLVGGTKLSKLICKFKIASPVGWLFKAIIKGVVSDLITIALFAILPLPATPSPDTWNLKSGNESINSPVS